MTRFLANPDFSVTWQENEDGILSPKAHPSSYGYRNGMNERFIAESYFVHDHFGNSFALTMAPTQRLVGEVSASILSIALGLPANPTYPVFIRRTENRVPDRQTALRLFRSFAPKGDFAPDGQYVPAVLRPHFELSKVDWGKISTDPKSVASFIMELAINFLYGAKVLESYPKHDESIFQNLGYVKSCNCFVMLGLEEPFSDRHYRAGKIESYFGEFPRTIVTKNSEDFQVKTFEALNLYVSRLENLKLSELQALLEPEFYMNGQDMESQDKTTDILFERIKLLRFELYMLLASWHAEGHFNGEALLKPLTSTPSPHVNLPSGVGHVKNPIEELWTRFFYAKSLGPGEDDKINLALSKAKFFQGFYGIWPENIPRNKGFDVNEKRNIQLNAHNEKTLIVHSSNDKEAEAVFKISKESGAKIFDLKLSHGAKISANQFDSVLSFAQKNDVRRLITIELPSFTPASKVQAKKLAHFNHFSIDHHEYEGDGSSYHRLASLEQLAHALGAELNLEEQFTAWIDRGGIYGLSQSGFPQNWIIGKFISDRTTRLASAMKHSQWKPEKIDGYKSRIHFLPEFPSSIFDYGIAMSAHYLHHGVRNPITLLGEDLIMMTRGFTASLHYVAPIWLAEIVDRCVTSFSVTKTYRYGDLNAHPVRTVHFSSPEEMERAVAAIFSTLRRKAIVAHDYQVRAFEHEFSVRRLYREYIGLLTQNNQRNYFKLVSQMLISTFVELSESSSFEDQRYLDDLFKVVADGLGTKNENPDSIVDQLIRTSGRRIAKVDGFDGFVDGAQRKLREQVFKNYAFSACSDAMMSNEE